MLVKATNKPTTAIITKVFLLRAFLMECSTLSASRSNLPSRAVNLPSSSVNFLSNLCSRATNLPSSLENLPSNLFSRAMTLSVTSLSFRSRWLMWLYWDLSSKG